MKMDFPRGTTIPASSYAAYQSLLHPAAEPPLKILVPNEYVGAVIGRGGATIRSISKTTGARLDIFRNCSRYDVPEKPVTIYGPPEKASKACRKILEIIADELNHQHEEKEEKEERREIALRMFAQDSYIGRVIGKGGSIIKKIMEETQTKIHISTQSDFVVKESSGSQRHYVPPVLERLITIRGSIDGMCKAEEVISEKLREAYENEIRMYLNGYNGRNVGTSLMGPRPYFWNGGPQTQDDGYSRSSTGPGGPSLRKFNSRTPFTLSSNQNNGGNNSTKQSDASISEFHGQMFGGARPVVPSVYDGAVSFDGSGDASRMPMSQKRNTSWKNSNSTSTTSPLMEKDLPRGTTIPASSYAAYQSAAEPPLKILVPNEYVGAVIGRGGTTIRLISKTTGARLSISRDCSKNDMPEKPVTIYGPPENASKACRKVLEIIADEVDHQHEERGETALRMFAQDSYIGRVIGKGGSIIKKIMEETLTKIHISTQSDFVVEESSGSNRHSVPPVLERLITIRGSINGMCRAEELISEKLRAAYRNEKRRYQNDYSGRNVTTSLMGPHPSIENGDPPIQDDGDSRSSTDPASPVDHVENSTQELHLPSTLSADQNNGGNSELRLCESQP